MNGSKNVANGFKIYMFPNYHKNENSINIINTGELEVDLTNNLNSMT